MNPQNSLIGDSNPTELPVMKMDDTSLIEEKKIAKYSKSKEFSRIQEHFEAKIAYYQQFLPGNLLPETIPEEERGKYWAVANLLIKEFREVIDMYKLAEEVVDNAKKDEYER